MDFKVEMLRERFFASIGGAILIIGLGLYIFLYRPLIVRLGPACIECEAIETQAQGVREGIALLKTKENKKSLITEEEVSTAVEELTREGKLKGINFISITQKEIEWAEEYVKCPIEIDAEATYKSLGLFLGLMDGLEKSLITLERINIKPSIEHPARLNAKMLINIYLSK